MTDEEAVSDAEVSEAADRALVKYHELYNALPTSPPEIPNWAVEMMVDQALGRWNIPNRRTENQEDEGCLEPD